MFENSKVEGGRGCKVIMRLYFRFYVNGWFSRLAFPHFSKVTLELPSSGGGGAERGGGGG